jgi:hypothetical protein
MHNLPQEGCIVEKELDIGWSMLQDFDGLIFHLSGEARYFRTPTNENLGVHRDAEELSPEIKGGICS